MPVRIYDIAKKLGLENKEILAKAKALGIAAAKVPSSSLDKITAEFSKRNCFKDHPDLAAQVRRTARRRNLPTPAPVEEKIVLITAPPPNRRRQSSRNRAADWNQKLQTASQPCAASVELPKHRAASTRRRRHRRRQKSAKKSGLFNCRKSPRRDRDTANYAGRGTSLPPAARLSRRGDSRSVRGGASPRIQRGHAGRSATANRPSPRRAASRRNLSRPTPAKSSSSNRRSSCATWPSN